MPATVLDGLKQHQSNEAATMVSDILGIFLAFIGQILLLSILVTTLVQITSAAFSIRQRNFRAVFRKVLTSLRTVNTEDPSANALKLEESEKFYSPSTSSNLLDKLVTPNGISWLSAQGLKRFLSNNPVDFTEAQKNAISEKFEEIELFMSKRFTAIMRYLSVFFAIVIALLFQANAMEMLNKLALDETYRERIIKEVESEAFNRLYTVSKDNWEGALNAAIRDYGMAHKSMIGYIEQIDKKVSTIAQARTDYLRILQGEGVSEPNKKADVFASILTKTASLYLSERVDHYDHTMRQATKLHLEIWSDPDYFNVDAATLFKRLFGLFFTIILLSLGAPFWFKILQNIVALRDVLSPSKVKA